MGGSGRGGTFYKRTPAELVRQVRKAEDQTTVAQFEAELSALLGELLASCNERDTELVQQRLENIKDALREEIDGAFDHLFGGSVAKHTYVDGLSDIDSLLLVNETALERTNPRYILARMQSILQDQLRGEATIQCGKMAITVKFGDGMVLQLLPSIRTPDGFLRVPSSQGDGWSDINPAAFREALTRRNQDCGNKLIPTIKLAKAVVAELPEDNRLSGYHIESLAISAFRGYEGQKTTSAMLPYFFDRARELVLSPIKDRTGQSIHVDDYLGGEASADRAVASHLLGRIAKRMRNASSSGSSSQWRELFGLDE